MNHSGLAVIGIGLWKFSEGTAAVVTSNQAAQCAHTALWLLQVLVADDSQLKWLTAERISSLLEAVQRKLATPPITIKFLSAIHIVL